MKNPFDKDFMPFLDEDFDIVSPFRSFEENKKALTEANISKYQMKLELTLLKSYKNTKIFERYNGQ